MKSSHELRTEYLRNFSRPPYVKKDNVPMMRMLDYLKPDKVTIQETDDHNQDGSWKLFEYCGYSGSRLSIGDVSYHSDSDDGYYPLSNLNFIL